MNSDHTRSLPSPNLSGSKIVSQSASSWDNPDAFSPFLPSRSPWEAAGCTPEGPDPLPSQRGHSCCTVYHHKWSPPLLLAFCSSSRKLTFSGKLTDLRYSSPGVLRYFSKDIHPKIQAHYAETLTRCRCRGSLWVEPSFRGKPNMPCPGVGLHRGPQVFKLSKNHQAFQPKAAAQTSCAGRRWVKTGDLRP